MRSPTVRLSTPAAPPLDLTALYASYTRFLVILNGLPVACASTSYCFQLFRPYDRPIRLSGIVTLTSSCDVGPGVRLHC